MSTLGEKSEARSFFPTGIDVEAMKVEAGLRGELNGDEQRRLARRMERRETLPYWLGGAGAPKKVWAAYFKDKAAKKQSKRKASEESNGSGEEKA